MQETTPTTWPDPLTPPDPQHVHALLAAFWAQLAALAPELADAQWLLAAERIDTLRRMVLEMMLALNGIARPQATSALNRYLSESQRTALEKTRLLPTVNLDGLVGQAVALVVIYRWYAPQLLDRFGGDYPSHAEQIAWQTLTAALPDWPAQVTTD
jgi:hypothetical protein